MSLAAVAAVDVDALAEVIPNSLEPCNQGFIYQNRIALAALTFEFIQAKVLRQLNLVGSFVGFYCHVNSSLFNGNIERCIFLCRHNIANGAAFNGVEFLTIHVDVGHTVHNLSRHGAEAFNRCK